MDIPINRRSIFVPFLGTKIIFAFFANAAIIFVPKNGTKIDGMQTHALGPPLFSRDMLFKRQNQFLTIVQNPITVFMMILPVAEMGEMANHGGSAAAMVKKGR